MCPNPQSIQRFFDCMRHYIYFVNYSDNFFFFFIRCPREQANHQKLVRDRDRDGGGGGIGDGSGGGGRDGSGKGDGDGGGGRS